MVIRFNIPNGRMEINLETFFQEARKAQIRKMLKWVSASWPNEENAREIREWLTDRRQDETDRAKAFAKKYVDCRTELVELQEMYERMQSPCYAVYTRDKEKLTNAKKDVSRYKAKIVRYKREMDEHRKLAERYEGILKDADKILGGNDGGS